MKWKFKLVSSLEKIFFEAPDSIPESVSGSMLKNELYSFQLVGWVSGLKKAKAAVHMKIESELAPYIRVYQVGYVPSLLPTIEYESDDDYITKTPGMFPDPLYPIKDGVLELCGDQSRAFWFAVEPRAEITGKFPIRIYISDDQGSLLEELCYTLEIIDVMLPESEVMCTGWFHGDCISVLHHVSMLSDEYYEIFEKFLEVYVKFGHNMILTPIFTPPLDTAVGGERPTNQLVDVYDHGGSYSFDFKKLKKFLDICRVHGIKYFEMAHLFTQWGAKCAPKIMAWVDGSYRQIFGWETDAASKEYRDFLDAFLPELIGFLKDEGVFDQCFFHVSDEPKAEDEESYRAARNMVAGYFRKDRMIDALSDYLYYEKGIVSVPVVANNHIQTFLEHNVENLWTYYCMGQRKEVANRFMAMPSYRNRVLGCQLYKYGIKGFLHWGYNFWFTARSTRVVNPYLETDAGTSFPSGDAFLVYPLNADKEVICSLRLYVFNEGLQDMRALKLLENLTDRETVFSFLEEINGFSQYPRRNDYLLTLRERINQKIKQRSRQ